MSECQWPYSNIKKEEFLARIIEAEKILQKYGACHVEDCRNTVTQISADGSYVSEKIRQHIWKQQNEYIRVAAIYFPEKPYLVLEFAEHREGPYEDADPFPYDIADADLEQEIRHSLPAD